MVHISLPFTSHWLELSHMAAPHCKGVWEMLFLAGQPFVQLKLRNLITDKAGREDRIPRNNYQFLSFV